MPSLTDPRPRPTPLLTFRLLGVARHNLHLVDGDGVAGVVRTVQLERHVFDDESPHLVAKAIGVEATLSSRLAKNTQSVLKTPITNIKDKGVMHQP